MMISGAEFNQFNKGTGFVKLTNKDCIHNGLEFKEGLNEDILEFDSSEECVPGGLYFCKYKKFGDWIQYRANIEYIWDVDIPDDAKVMTMDYKIKCDKFILSNKRSIWNDKIICTELVSQNGNFLCYVNNQTNKLCLEAIKKMEICYIW